MWGDLGWSIIELTRFAWSLATQASHTKKDSYQNNTLKRFLSKAAHLSEYWKKLIEIGFIKPFYLRFLLNLSNFKHKCHPKYSQRVKEACDTTSRHYVQLLFLAKIILIPFRIWTPASPSRAKCDHVVFFYLSSVFMAMITKHQVKHNAEKWNKHFPKNPT